MEEKKTYIDKCIFWLMIFSLIITNFVTARFFNNNEVTFFENVNGVFTALRIEPKGMCKQEQIDLSNLVSEVYND